ncbi:MAG TPA: LptA/OstA family protein, partial [bacterium]|nr:LptA/OstA family protein [bacterium]
MRSLVLGIVVALLLPGMAAAQIEIPEVGQGRLRAERVRYDARAKVFYAEGNVRLTLGDTEVQAPRLRVDQGKQIVFAAGGVVVRQPDTLLRSEELTYEIRSRTAHASGTVVLTQAGTTVSAAEVTFDVAGQVARARGSVRLDREGSTLTGDEMVAHMKTKVAEVMGHASLVRAPRALPGSQDGAAQALADQETTITADRMRFRWDANEAEAEGTVTVTQPDKTARARKLVYSEVRNVLELTGDVVVDQRSGEWLATEDPEAARALASRTVMACDRVVIQLRSRDMQADGAIRVEQEGRLATGDHALYTSRERMLVVTGNVHIREADGSWLRADKVVISLADET